MSANIHRVKLKPITIEDFYENACCMLLNSTRVNLTHAIGKPFLHEVQHSYTTPTSQCTSPLCHASIG